MSRLSIIFAALAAVLLSLPLGAAADRPMAGLGADGAVMADKGGEVQLTMALTRPVPWRLGFVDGPPRMVVELTDFDWTDAPVSRSTSVAAIETLQTGPARTEMHAYLREPLHVVSAEMRTHEDGTALLAVVLQPTTAEDFRVALDEAIIGAVPPEDRLTVAIDPGHGGTDPGAQAGELTEAALVMGFAERLREVLEQSGRFNVVLTRDDDRLVSLDRRLSLARAAGADILLSIHADTLQDAGAASGIVVYRLSEEAAPEADERLTERHAPDDRLSGVDLTGAGDDVTLALLDLARQEAAPLTAALSAKMVDAFRGTGLTVNSRPERTADFAVLKAADIPSLLIELGFLSTPADLARLTSETWQLEAARAMRDALMLWQDEARFSR